MRKEKPQAAGEKPEARSQKPEGDKKTPGRFRVFVFTSGFWLVASGFFLSCSARESADRRSEKTLRDPMGYSPQFEKTDVSGGGWLEYDKDGMRKDMKNVLDP